MANHEYSDGEVQEILKRAAAIDGNRDFSRHVLEQTAAELGISKEAVVRAEAEYAAQVTTQAEIEAYKRHRRAGFYQHLASYISINLFMIGIWWMTGAKYPWFIWVILGWGIGIALNAISAWSTTGDEFERGLEEWRDKKRQGIAI